MPRQKSKPINKNTGVRAVDRAVEILRAFSAERPAMSVLEIQKKVRLSRPTVYRLLETLASHGFVRAHGTPQRFSLDYAVGQLAQNWLEGLDPVAAGQPIIERLHEQTKETVSLNILRGDQGYRVLELPSPHVLSMARGIGPMGHLGRGASGKAILAFMSEKDIEAVVRTLPKGVHKDAVMAELAAIRRDKFSVTRSEIFDGAVGIAAPYFDNANRVVGSVIVFGPELRFDEERIVKVTKGVLASAAELSSALGQVSARQIQRPAAGERGRAQSA
jgi:IclR family transcriptional regulator, acetate operon repressor